ncbi:MAG: transketolase [Deltaproteobacteria bacterium]|nr:transketolase [Deltaproteobacteria bacterium]
MKVDNELCVNTIRMLAVDCIESAKSGHPGLPMGAAPMAYVLYTRFLRHNPLNPLWPDRDRFVLSAGHGSAMLYALLYLTGYGLTIEDLKEFRQWNSKTPGHPERGVTAGVETTTGPLGQGFANGVGMAIAERFLAARFNRPGPSIVDHYTYVIAGDGDLMEGISHEAASLAGHLRLGKLICLYDDNHISIEGHTDLSFTEDVKARFAAYGWDVQQVEDGNDLDAIENAILSAQKQTHRPSLIAVRSVIGYGSPNKADSPSAHGAPLGPEETGLTKERLGWPTDKPFYVPEEVLAHFRKAIKKGKQLEKEWKERCHFYRQEFPDLYEQFDSIMKDELPADWARDIPFFPADKKGIATRVASGKVLNAIATYLFNLIGGSADLAPSNKTLITGEKDLEPNNYSGRNIHFGVREHGMGGILNGMALHGGLIPYGGTFLVFSDYMRASIRMAALMGIRVIYVFTHDSIGVGEDGPTHQPIEHLLSLRSIPNLTVIRPADANETAEAWQIAIKSFDRPVALSLTRQALPVLDRKEFAPAEGLRRGAYILKEAKDDRPDIILLSTGSEVHVAISASRALEERNISVRVVSMPSWELFDRQTEQYQQDVLYNKKIPIIAIEAGSSMGWHKYIGVNGAVIGIDHFGASAPAKVLFEKFGITAETVVKKAMELIGQ